jgi:hypothetical protein
LWIPMKEGIGVTRGPRQGEDKVTLHITLMCEWNLKYFYIMNGHVPKLHVSKWEVIDPIKVWSFNSMP